ncbi:DUF6114 domain-containing protein [Streptomyces olivoreticuli]|uniref:DUF6114 domain-containing protein n=1 Tax=Streptomyces olivoreticuli TaxID=68246 RepID=UPI001F08135D|nr:DUF6114 domain-containing protein [Streptomyces olivoreticuli]
MAAGIESGRPRRHPWAAWRQWRKGRPFWGGLATVLAGAEICAIPLAPLKVMLHQGIAGIPSVLMGLVMILMGLSAWFAPQYRTLAGIVTVMVAAATLVMSNLGGFLIGTLMGVVGGAMIFAWQPLPAEPATARGGAVPGGEPLPADAGGVPDRETGAPGSPPSDPATEDPGAEPGVQGSSDSSAAGTPAAPNDSEPDATPGSPPPGAGAPASPPAEPAPDPQADPPVDTLTAPPPDPPESPGSGPRDTAPRPPAGPSAEIGPWTPAQRSPRSGPVRDVDHQPRPHLPHQRSSDDRS